MLKKFRIFALFLFFVLLQSPKDIVAADQVIRGVIIADANLRVNPSDTARVILPLRQDTMVLLGDNDNGWVKVDIPSLRQSGWVHGSLVRPVAESLILQQNKKKIIGPDQQKISKTEPLKKKNPEPSAQAIAVIDIQQVIDQSIRGREARDRFEKMRESDQTEQLDKIEKEMISHVIAEIRSIVEQYAGEKGFTQVLNKNSGSIFYTDPRFDITDDIIREYDRRINLQQNRP